MRRPVESSSVSVTSRLADTRMKAHEGFSVASRLGRGVSERTGKALKTGARTVGSHVDASGEADPLNGVQSDAVTSTRAVTRTGRSGVGKAMSLGNSVASRISSKGTGKVAAGRSLRRGPVSSAQRVLRRSSKKRAVKAIGRETGSAATSVANLVARVSSGVVRRVGVVIASASSVPLLLIVGVTTAIVAVVLSLVSWIPGFAAAQNSSEIGDMAGDFPIADDYPYKGKYGGTSPLGYAYGNCTDFVAWRMNRDSGTSKPPWKLKHAELTPLGGNGWEWGRQGSLPGWQTLTSLTSLAPGDVVSIPAGVKVLGASGGVYGHVAYVGQISNGVVTIENYGNGKYFLTSPTVVQLAGYVAAGQAVVKHNPKGRSTGGGDAKAYAKAQLNNDSEYQCLVQLWDHESGWRVNADNPSSDAYGIPQALPGSKMASAGADWKTNGITQVKWGLSYIKGRPDYGTPCKAWALWQSRSPHWY